MVLTDVHSAVVLIGIFKFCLLSYFGDLVQDRIVPKYENLFSLKPPNFTKSR
jgi:hypothetical protein